VFSQSGSTNGFRFSESFLGQKTDEKARYMAVVPLRGGLSYGVHHTAARRVAKAKKAFGFWRRKQSA
jgi:hypothetical protein